MRILIPIILVHGLGGFGPDELNGVKYWNYIDDLKITYPDTPIYEASVGPVSSNWDRAQELYAQIKGGLVDYGLEHSREYGHYRYGRNYSNGLYPQWDEDHPVHLVGHSMGGQTILELERILESKNKKWIRSITTISTPHKGSPLVDLMGWDFVDLIKDLILKFASLTNNTHFEKFYDLDLDHFGIYKLPQETLKDSLERITSFSVWRSDYKDISSHDLSPKGSEELYSKRQNVYDNVYYFSIGTSRTFELCIPLYGCYHVPSPLMWSFMWTPSLTMNTKNDGLVPLDSSLCPYECENYTTKPKTKTWYQKHINADHLQILGYLKNKEVLDFYLDHVGLLVSLDGKDF